MVFDWKPITRHEAGNEFSMKSILELVFLYQENLKQLVLEFIGRNVVLQKWDLDAEPAMYAERVNRIEQNLRLLVGTDVPEHMIRTVFWHGEFTDDRRFDYTDVNRWFEILRLMYRLIQAFSRRFLVTGTFVTSQFPEMQRFAMFSSPDLRPPPPPPLVMI